MSWSVTYESLDAFTKGETKYPMGEHEERAADQIAVARAAAQEIIESGVIGTAKDFTVFLGGHSNPNHEPCDGWANDCLTVTINQKSPPTAS